MDRGGSSTETAQTIVDDYVLQRLLTHHVQTLATRRPQPTVQVLEGRVRDVYATELHKERSTIYRPAIEENSQNHAFRYAENCTVEALRDALQTWAGLEPDEARMYVEGLLGDEQEILRRVAIYTMNQAWPTMRSLYLPFVKSGPFTAGHLHELYALLDNRFVDFELREVQATLKVLQELTAPEYSEQPEVARKRLQKRWLSAIVGKGVPEADEWLAKLNADESAGAVPAHPDFASYMTFRAGPGDSVYSKEELVGFADARTLTDRIDSFEQKDPWSGPTLDGLASTLQQAAQSNPETFIRTLPHLLSAKPAFKRAVINGLHQAWDTKQQPTPGNWAQAWEELMSFFEQLVAQPSPVAGEDNQREWLLVDIADCLRAGMQLDEHAFSPELLPRGKAIIDAILEQLPAAKKLAEDPMSTAVNTPKGRAIEALFSHALRACRVSDQVNGDHATTWKELQPMFDRELNACRDNNLEFSTLCGAYLAQLDYLNAEWTIERIADIFPAAFPTNDQAAISGLAYAAFTQRIYEHLLNGNILDRALEYDLKGREARERLLERVAAAYVWGVEPLDSPRFRTIFSSGDSKDLEQITWAFWTLRHQNVTEEQRERIIEFWDRCIISTSARTSVPVSLLSALGSLAAYVTALDERTLRLLLAVAPYVGVGHAVYEFIDELLRLAERNPDGISSVLNAMITAHVPEYDYEDRLLKLLKTLAAKGKKNEVLSMLDRLLPLPGMHNLFNELTRPATG